MSDRPTDWTPLLQNEDICAALGKFARWISDNQERLIDLKNKVDAEVNSRIASHPDLANLDDWLDDHYG